MGKFGKWLSEPERLWSRAEILLPSARCPVPREGGVYGWFFRSIPEPVPTNGCLQNGNLTLLYLGISPQAPPANGRPPSRQTLLHRIRYHMRGNAEGSTLRLTLGCLLQEKLGIELRRVGSGSRMTFTIPGEEKLSAWLDENAFVCWYVHPRPWEPEEELIRIIPLPLNLQGNKSHPFHPVLSAIRSKAKEKARSLPVVAR